MQVATPETDKETHGKFMWSETIAKSCSVQREEKQSGHPKTSVLAQPLDKTVNFGDLLCCQFSLHRFFLKVKQKDNENESASDNIQQLSDEIGIQYFSFALHTDMQPKPPPKPLVNATQILRYKWKPEGFCCLLPIDFI